MPLSAATLFKCSSTCQQSKGAPYDHLMFLDSGDPKLAALLTSGSQRARVITEAWIAENAYCVACSSERLLATAPNTKARDFECVCCGHPYELKSSSAGFGKRVVDGAYASMIARIREGSTPNLLLLHYGPEWQVKNLSLIHRLLLTEPAIEQRPPLSPTARRAGWVGCNILLANIPLEGRIPIVSAGVAIPPDQVRRRYALSQSFDAISPVARGWAAAVLSKLRKLGKDEFTLQEAYFMETELSALYPENRHVRPKIRQQLQVLRDLGILRFETKGRYSFIIRSGSGGAL